MADLQTRYSTSDYTTDGMGFLIDDIMKNAKIKRMPFERRWYDNNFFDDGFHFRMMSRQINKIVDLTAKASLYNPLRAIPKASRQLRGISNLLIAPQYVPVVYPDMVDVPKTIQGQPNPQYQQMDEMNKEVAKRSGQWLTEEYKDQEIIEKLIFMIILTGKHGVSYLKVWPDAVKEAINTSVRDAFDCYLSGNLTSIYDSPFFGEGVPRAIAEIKADENFEEEQTSKLSPDNRLAGSEIKDAYEKARHGGISNVDAIATLIQKEFFLKEFINDEVESRIKKQDNAEEVLAGKSRGDIVIRQAFAADNICLKDTYTTLSEYPYVDLRFEPGPIYQVPLIERFIPANKSLDLVSSRVERYTHTMVTGSWSKRKGEQFKIDNSAGGQVIEYNGQPPIQNQIAPIPAFVFNYMSFLNSVIEEQGVTTATLGKLPQGVKANSAIENLKQSEYSNLAIPQTMVKKTVKKLSEKMLEIADTHFVTPKTVYRADKGNPDYFQVMGKTAMEKLSQRGVSVPRNAVPLSKGQKVNIEVESGLGYTVQGKREAADRLIDRMTILAQQGLINPESIKPLVERYLETYQYGNLAEFMETLENGPLTDQQAQSVKVAVMEVVADLQKAGIFPTSEQRVKEGTLATAQALKDTGVAGKKETPDKGPSKSISFKDLPPIGKAQLAEQAGIQLDPNEIEADEMQEKEQESQMQERQLQLKENQINAKQGGSQNADDEGDQ